MFLSGQNMNHYMRLGGWSTGWRAGIGHWWGARGTAQHPNRGFLVNESRPQAPVSVHTFWTLFFFANLSLDLWPVTVYSNVLVNVHTSASACKLSNSSGCQTYSISLPSCTQPHTNCKRLAASRMQHWWAFACHLWHPGAICTRLAASCYNLYATCSTLVRFVRDWQHPGTTCTRLAVTLFAIDWLWEVHNYCSALCCWEYVS